MRRVGRAALAAMVALCCWCGRGAAQAARVYTAADYAQAEKFMDYNVDPLVSHTVEHPVWLGDGRFWYRDAGPDGLTYMLVDPARRTKGPAFDHGKLAAALSAAIGSGKLAISRLSFSEFASFTNLPFGKWLRYASTSAVVLAFWASSQLI